MCLLPSFCLHGARGDRYCGVLQRGLLRLRIHLHLRYTRPLSSSTRPTPAPQLIRFLSLSLLRLCVGHLIPLAVLPFPHVCCQTAHSHDGELPWNPGNTDLLISPRAYRYTSSANSHSSLLVIRLRPLYSHTSCIIFFGIFFFSLLSPCRIILL